MIDLFKVFIKFYLFLKKKFKYYYVKIIKLNILSFFVKFICLYFPYCHFNYLFLKKLIFLNIKNYSYYFLIIYFL
jgi:hypothetical protein